MPAQSAFRMSVCIHDQVADLFLYSVSLFREEEELYVLLSLHGREDGLSTTDQDDQHPQLHRRGGEGFKTLIVLLLSPLLLRHSHGSRLIETLAIRATLDACPVPFV